MTPSGLFLWPWLRFQRWRIGMGFSVHSPFAYHLITDVLRERWPYYAFRTEVTDPAERTLFRVAAFVDPRTVAFPEPCPRLERVVALACPRARQVDKTDEADLTVSLDAIPSDFRALYCARAPQVSAPGAMSFSNGRALVAFRRRNLPAQAFRLDF